MNTLHPRQSAICRSSICRASRTSASSVAMFWAAVVVLIALAIGIVSWGGPA